jgi:pyroglutamyl-peptidase
MKQIRVTVSGFEPFEGEAINPSKEVAFRLASEEVQDQLAAMTGCEILVDAIELPLSFSNAWSTLKTRLDQTRPNIVIACGLKHSATAVNLERCALNYIDAEMPDSDNLQPRKVKVREEGPASFWTGIPLRDILSAFANDQIPAKLSSDAGTYICNALFYELMNWTAEQTHVSSGFVSLPPVEAATHYSKGLSLDQMTRAGIDVITQSVEYYNEIVE